MSILFAQPPENGRDQNSISIVDLQSEPAVVQPTRSLIWRVERSDMDRPSYVFAIPYLVPNDWFFLPPELSNIVTSVDQLVLEVDPSYRNMDVIHRGAVPFDSTLEALLPRRQYNEMYAFIRDSLSAMARYKLENRYEPLMLAQQIMADYCAGFRVSRQPYYYEKYLAQAIGKPVRSLQSEWTRTAWMEDYNITEQTDALVNIFRDRQVLKVKYKSYLRAYRSGNLDEAALLALDLPDLGGGTGRMIGDKNLSWLPMLSRSMRFESLLIAVNAAQLAGEQGLLHQLRRQGYDVSPVGR
ncbi:MAG: TraB/GumN family protein [Bacteroidota bacterium]